MEEKHKEGKLRQLAHRLLGIKLGYRMFFIYIIGGFLPLILIGVYLIHGTSRRKMRRYRSWIRLQLRYQNWREL